MLKDPPIYREVCSITIVLFKPLSKKRWIDFLSGKLLNSDNFPLSLQVYKLKIINVDIEKGG